MPSEEQPKPLSPVSSIVKRRSWLVPVASVLILILLAGAFYTISVRERTSDLLVTVNGEPIYAADIEDTIRLLPEQYQTPENRASFLNQTIDLVLLKQEALRRGITVPDADVKSRIETVLNDTGRSPQELRIILAERNLTPQQYEKIIADSLIVEKLTTEAVTNRIAVSEQEIVAYYQDHQTEFVPPTGAARISHILVDTEATARQIITSLNRGDRFRDLAIEYSTDSETAAAGGTLGIVRPTDQYPAAFLQAALSLLENQYTRSPVKTASGYHVILRQFNLPDVQEVRSFIQPKLLAEKQREGFAALIEGLRADASIRFYTESGVVSTQSTASLESFAACVGRNSVLYGVQWSESFREQQDLFSSSASLLTFVDCDAQPSVCNAAGISKYPTWVIDGKPYGTLSISNLAEHTECKLPK